MKPLDLGKGGLYVAGLAHSPRFLEEAIAQGQGAAMRAAAYLAPGEVAERPTAVWVNERLCSFCGLCVEACPFEARVMDYDARVADRRVWAVPGVRGVCDGVSQQGDAAKGVRAPAVVGRRRHGAGLAGGERTCW